MKDEIKEILDRIETASEIFDCLLKPKECTVLLDYITNLQQEKYELERDNKHLNGLLDTALNEQDRLQNENEILTNNWNELEEFIQKELDNNVDGIKSFGGYQCKIILDKMKEIKENN